ncbi:alcohol dehydrogenase catalytic domain-containing protein [Streptomyces mirabilis]|nr:alcohol dehydrogenase catalytic domain-containing protein [Streptomyces mirabilis]
MRAARCHAVGGPVVVEEIPDPDGQVPVDVHYAAVNFADVLVIEGTYQVKAEPPFTPGSEFAGVVAESGHGFEKGERVFGSVFVGAFAERVAVRAASLYRIPDTIPTRRAAAFGVSHATAYNALTLIGRLQEGAGGGAGRGQRGRSRGRRTGRAARGGGGRRGLHRGEAGGLSGTGRP